LDRQIGGKDVYWQRQIRSTPMGKSSRRSSFGIGKMIGRRSGAFEIGKMMGKVGRKVLAPIRELYSSGSYGGYLKSPSAKKRRSGNYMAELVEFKDKRENFSVTFQAQEMSEDISQGAVVQTPARRRGISGFPAKGKSFFTPAKFRPRIFNNLTPAHLRGGWSGNLAECEEVLVFDTNVFMHHIGLMEDVLRFSDSMIYFASIVRRELDGLKKNKEAETRFKARRANRTVLRAIRRRNIATQTVEEEQEAKRRWPGDILNGDDNLIATCKWLRDVRGVEVVLVAGDISNENFARSQGVACRTHDDLKRALL